MLLNENLFEAVDDMSKDEYLRNAAEIAWESGHGYDPDDFSYFKKVCKEDGYDVTEADFDKYFEYFDECRANHFADEDDIDLGDWEEMESKQVEDSDGFMTDYTWYVKDNEDGSETHVMIFGDQDLYNPLNTEPDAEFDAEDVAREWFNAYNGFAEDDDLEEAVLFENQNTLESTDTKVKLEVMFEVYDRSPNINLRTARISGRDVKEALTKMLDHMNMYLTSEDILEYEEESGEKMSADDILEKLEEENGDGCDYIYYIKNLNTNEIIFEGDYTPEAEDWDSDELEESMLVEGTAGKLPETAMGGKLEVVELDTKEFGFKPGDQWLITKSRSNYIPKDKVEGSIIEIVDIVAPDNMVDTYLVRFYSHKDQEILPGMLDLNMFIKFFEATEKQLIENLNKEAKPELVNGYKIFKADSTDTYFVMDGDGYHNHPEFANKGYQTKQEAIDRANSLEKGKATTLEEKLEGFDQIEEFTTLGKKLGFKTLHQMRAVMEIAHAKGISELDMLRDLDKEYNGKVPKDLIDGLQLEVVELGEKIGLDPSDPDCNKAYFRFCKEERQPGETVLQAMKRYYQELIDGGFDPDHMNESIKLAEMAMLNIDKNAIFNKLGCAKIAVENNNFSEATSALKDILQLLKTPILEGAMSELDLEIQEEGGVENWKAKAKAQLAEMEDDLKYFKSYTPKEIKAGSNFESIAELNATIKETEDMISELKAKINCVG